MMKDQELLDRIIVDPKVMTGKRVIKWTRLTVGYILNLLAHGATTANILDEDEGITEEDVQACILFATIRHKLSGRCCIHAADGGERIDALHGR